MLVISNKSSARALLNLPHDISRQILEDVPLYRVLAMAACLDGTEDGQSFRTLLLSLSLQSTFFPDENHLTYMIGLYKLYQDVRQSVHRHTKQLGHPQKSPLSKNLSAESLPHQWLPKARQWAAERILQRNWLLFQLHDMLQSFGWSERPHIFPSADLPKDVYVPDQDHARFDRYKEYWQTVKERHFRFATKRQAQIQRLVEIFREYPTYLKKTSDPGFGFRSNHTHIINRLESCAKQYRKDLLLKHYMARECHFYRYDLLPILPLDKYLVLFIHTLARYPYDCSNSDLDHSSRSHPKAENVDNAGLLISNETPPPSLIYPSYIQDDIDRVMNGLAYINTSENAIPDVSKYLGCRKLTKRTKFTVYSAAELKRRATLTCEFCTDTNHSTICYNCYRTLLRLPEWTRNSKSDDKTPSPKFPVLTADSLGFQDTLLLSPKPVFTVPPWPHLQQLEGYGFFEVDNPSLAKRLTQLNIPVSSTMKAELDIGGIFRNYRAGRIVHGPGHQEKFDEWDESEFQWLESFLRVIKWIEANFDSVD